MIDRTTLLFALPGFRVLNVTSEPDGGRLVLVESIAKDGGCPSCGVMSSRIKERPIYRLKDLPHGSAPLRVWLCKRRFLCAEQLCARGSFTEVSDQVSARSRLTKRLRTKVSAAVTATNRAMSEVAGEYGVAWWTVHRILVATAVQVLGQAAPTTMIGIDETRARSVRWFFKETGWARSDPWMTSIVDLDPTHTAGIIGLAPGRSRACVEAWLALQTKEFRDGVTVVAIDPSAPYATGIRRALPQARIVLDHFHVVMLANKMLTDARQRVQHEQQGRRGMTVDPAWAHRRLLLRTGNELGPKALARLKTVFKTDDPTNEISAAWGVKELLRQMLAVHGPNGYSRHETSTRRTRFLQTCVDADMPEATRLAGTIEKWWPEIEGFLQLGNTNSRSEGYNRLAKHQGRNAFGFRNPVNQRRRIRWACTRQYRRASAARSTLTAQV